MPIQFVLLPLFVEVVLTFGLMFWHALLRAPRRFKRGETRLKDIALREPNWPARATQFAYAAFDNQFELPVLFYVLTILSIITHHADLVFVVLAWIFVSVAAGARLCARTTNNRALARRRSTASARWCWSSMWVIFMVRILLGLP